MDIFETIQTNDIGKIQTAFKENKPDRKVEVETCNKQYSVLKHDVFDKTKREDKTVKKPTGQKDPVTGKDKFDTAIEEVVRVGLNIQKLIVKRSVGFMLGNPVELNVEYEQESESAELLYKMIKRTWKDNKLDFKNKEIARLLFKECEVAELWYYVDDEKYWGQLSPKSKRRLKMRILADSYGDTMYPYFDASGDMVAFARHYKTGSGETEVEHFDIYTAEKILKWEKTKSGEWALSDNQVESPGKISIIYYKIDQPDWYDVQNLIDRLETSMSNHGDTDDYNASPILFAKGKVSGLPNKGSRGKALSGDDGSDAKYLNWDSMPESIKLEQENLKSSIYELTQTPDISFSNLKGIGSALSGVALKLMFADAHMKATDNWEIFGIGVQRRLNLLKRMIGSVINVSLEKEEHNLRLEPECVPYLPVNEKELADMVDNAVAVGSISKQTGYENHPLVTNPDEEAERVNVERVESLSGSEI
jgi:SPP1 family phage portal protein